MIPVGVRDPDGFPPPLSPEAAAELVRRRRGRNLAMLAGLLTLVVLFYFISIAKLSHPEHAHPTAPAAAPAP